jgi:hypothetical protein
VGFLYYEKLYPFLDKAGQERDFIGNNAMDKARLRQVMEQRAWPEWSCMEGAIPLADNQWDEGFFADAGVYR